MTITHIFFDMNGVLIDPHQMHLCSSAALGPFLAQRYGGDPAAWERANHQILEDWDSYYADLDFSGDDCVEQMWEGEFRVTRARFRLTNTPEPSKDELSALSREILVTLPARCAAVYPEVHDVLRQLLAAGITISVTSHALEPYIHAALTGSGLLDYFNGVIIGTDTMDHFLKDAGYYQHAAYLLKVDPAQCAVLDDRPEPIEGAKQAGMETIFVCRPARCRDLRVHADALITDLTHLIPRYIPA